MFEIGSRIIEIGDYYVFFTFSEKPDDYCSKRPFDKIANELNCATYFDCSKPRSIYGPYLQECSYPLLYDRNAKSCRAFSVVRCGKRFEPMEPCEYMCIHTSFELSNVSIITTSNT